MCFYFIKNNTLNYFIMDKQTYETPTIDFCEILIENSFAASQTGAENLQDGGNW